MMKKIILYTTILIIFLFSCDINSDNTTCTILTNRPELVSYVEVFNSLQDEYKVHITYDKAPNLLFPSLQEMPDMIIGDWLHTPSLIEQFSNLGPIIQKDEESEPIIDMSIFYQEMLRLGKKEDTQYLLPLAFDLPVLISNKEEDEGTAVSVITLEEIVQRSADINKKKSGAYTNMAFSPRWNREFLYLTARLFGAGFMDKGNILTWNNRSIEDSVTFTADWIKNTNTTPELEDSFQEKYMYEPDYKLIADGRIGFSFMTLTNYFQLPEERRQYLNFQYLIKHDIIPVNENITLFGIPQGAKNKEAASVFMSWLFTVETQKKLIENLRSKQTRNFGFAGGFSSLKEINEKVLPTFFPFLVGKIPPENFLGFPQSLPTYWNDLKEEVLIPWLYRRVTGLSDEQLRPVVDDWISRHEQIFEVDPKNE